VTRSRTGFEPVLGRSRRRAADWPAAERVPSSIASAPQTGESVQLRKRIEELTPVLVGLARDLAGARRESLTLRRENDLLRSRLSLLEQRTARRRSLRANRAPEHVGSEERLLRRPGQLAGRGTRG
jgi:hypothetical protein